MTTDTPIWQIVSDEFDCPHDDTEFTRFQQSNGAIIVAEQCLTCGHNLGARRKADHNWKNLPWFNQDRREADEYEMPF